MMTTSYRGMYRLDVNGKPAHIQVTSPGGHSLLRIPRDGGQGSMLMAGSIPRSSRALFHGDVGQCSILMADTLAVF